MKCVVKFGIVVLLLFLPSSFVAASQWDEYSAFIEKFYYLDKQEFTDISCQIDVSSLNNSVEQIKAQLKPFESDITIIENVSEFRMNLNRKTGLTFNLPFLDVKIVSEEGIKDPETVRSGIDMMKLGFKQQVTGTTQVIMSIFESYISPKKETFKIKNFSTDQDEVTLIYETDTIDVTQKFSGNRCKMEIVSKKPVNGARFNVQSEMVFEKIEDRMTVSEIFTHLDNGMMTTDTHTSVKYHIVKTVLFPSTITNKSKLVTQGARLEGEVTIHLRNCRMH
jgi:hypothetical protein